MSLDRFDGKHIQGYFESAECEASPTLKRLAIEFVLGIAGAAFVVLTILYFATGGTFGGGR